MPPHNKPAHTVHFIRGLDDKPPGDYQLKMVESWASYSGKRSRPVHYIIWKATEPIESPIQIEEEEESNPRARAASPQVTRS